MADCNILNGTQMNGTQMNGTQMNEDEDDSYQTVDDDFMIEKMKTFLDIYHDLKYYIHIYIQNIKHIHTIFQFLNESQYQSFLNMDSLIELAHQFYEYYELHNSDILYSNEYLISKHLYLYDMQQFQSSELYDILIFCHAEYFYHIHSEQTQVSHLIHKFVQFGYYYHFYISNITKIHDYDLEYCIEQLSIS